MTNSYAPGLSIEVISIIRERRLSTVLLSLKDIDYEGEGEGEGCLSIRMCMEARWKLVRSVGVAVITSA